jgi:hypothetical protein
LEGPSEWDEQLKRMNTPDKVNAKIRVASAVYSTVTALDSEVESDGAKATTEQKIESVSAFHLGPTMDIVGRLVLHASTPMEVLETFDLPPSRVGFFWKDQNTNKEWILHSDHRMPIAAPVDAKSRAARAAQVNVKKRKRSNSNSGNEMGDAARSKRHMWARYHSVEAKEANVELKLEEPEQTLEPRVNLEQDTTGDVLDRYLRPFPLSEDVFISDPSNGTKQRERREKYLDRHYANGGQCDCDRVPANEIGLL